MPAKKTRERAVAVIGSGVGVARYKLYQNAWQRIVAASRAGFHLEAITLLESILTDRMESRATYLAKKNLGFRTLGELITRLEAIETVSEFRPILKEIDAWRVHRNKALHEMVKFEAGERPLWEQRLGPLAEVVREGKRVLRAFDALDKRERRRNGARPAATEPAAFGKRRIKVT